jgi:hypothetical protein
VSLALFTAVIEWVEQLRIKTCQASPRFSASISSLSYVFVGIEMSLVLGGLATSTLWPHSCSSTLLTHGEWVPASMALCAVVVAAAPRRSAA